jgi:phosphatidylglycerophosphate synthase
MRVAVAPPMAEFAAVAVGLAIGLGLLAMTALDAEPGATLVALVTFAALATVAGRALYLRYPHDRLGLCNAITLMRLALAVSLVAPVVAGAAPSWAVLAVAVVALGLDGIDGWLARRQGYVSEFGARFDMEVDSVLALVLAVSAAVSGDLGPAAILLGVPRYAFALALWAVPWMRRDLPERFSRKLVCVVQLSALIALQLPILPTGPAMAMVTVAGLALAWSFAVDVVWLWRRRA